MLAAVVTESRTQKATSRKLARARASGDRPWSAEWAATATLAWVCIWVGQQGYTLWDALRALTQRGLSGRPPDAALWSALLQPLATLLLPLPCAALFAVLMQRGFSVRFGRDDRDAEPTRAAQRLGRVFSAEPWQESLLGLIKLGVLSWVLLEGMRGSLPGLLDVRDPSELLQLALRLGRSMGLRAVVALALLGGIDLLFQHWRRARRLRMSRRELQEEQRESEGDPRWLGERRARSQALWSQAWLAELEAASLVIAASDRALALRYRPGIDAAPSLWVKGQGLSCERLLEHARSLDLPVHIDEALAHDLYRLEPSEIIPEATQQRVAALFARSAGTA